MVVPFPCPCPCPCPLVLVVVWKLALVASVPESGWILGCGLSGSGDGSTGVAGVGLGGAGVWSDGREVSAGWRAKAEESGWDMWGYEIMTGEKSCCY